MPSSGHALPCGPLARLPGNASSLHERQAWVDQKVFPHGDVGPTATKLKGRPCGLRTHRSAAGFGVQTSPPHVDWPLRISCISDYDISSYPKGPPALRDGAMARMPSPQLRYCNIQTQGNACSCCSWPSSTQPQISARLQPYSNAAGLAAYDTDGHFLITPQTMPNTTLHDYGLILATTSEYATTFSPPRPYSFQTPWPSSGHFQRTGVYSASFQFGEREV